MEEKELKEGEDDTQRVIILPVDDSIHSERAFNWYIKNLRKNEDTLVIVHVNETPNISTEGTLIDRTEKWQSAYKEILDESKELVRKFINKAKDIGIEAKSVLTWSTSGGAGRSICDVAAKKHASNIVMGSRGLNVLRRTLLGSVSYYYYYYY